MSDLNLNKTTEENRPSLAQGMVDRYANQHAGGAFDDKTQVVTDAGKTNEISLAGTTGNVGYSDTKWTIHKGFLVKMRLGQTEQKDPEGSMYLQGHSTKKYKA